MNWKILNIPSTYFSIQLKLFLPVSSFRVELSIIQHDVSVSLFFRYITFVVLFIYLVTLGTSYQSTIITGVFRYPFSVYQVTILLNDYYTFFFFFDIGMDHVKCLVVKYTPPYFDILFSSFSSPYEDTRLSCLSE